MLPLPHFKFGLALLAQYAGQEAVFHLEHVHQQPGHAAISIDPGVDRDQAVMGLEGERVGGGDDECRRNRHFVEVVRHQRPCQVYGQKNKERAQCEPAVHLPACRDPVPGFFGVDGHLSVRPGIHKDTKSSALFWEFFATFAKIPRYHVLYR